MAETGPKWVTDRSQDAPGQGEGETAGSSGSPAEPYPNAAALVKHRWRPGVSGNPVGLSPVQIARREAVNSQDPRRVTVVLNMLYETAIDAGTSEKNRISAGRAYLEVVGMVGAPTKEDESKIERMIEDRLRGMLAEARAEVERESRPGAIDVEAGTGPGESPSR